MEINDRAGINPFVGPAYQPRLGPPLEPPGGFPDEAVLTCESHADGSSHATLLDLAPKVHGSNRNSDCNLRQGARHLKDDFFTVFFWDFSGPYGPIRAHMDPYGPI